MLQTDNVSERDMIITKKMKAAKDLSKLFMLLEFDEMSHFLMLDTRFIGYKSGVIHNSATLIYESCEYVKFIKNKYEECATFWNNAYKKYNVEITGMEKACNIIDNKTKGKLTEKTTGKDKPAKSITDELKMLVVFSMMSKGLQIYFDKTYRDSL